MVKTPLAPPEDAQGRVFSCLRCGECCQGKGGIVAGPRDLSRLCAHFNMEEEKFIAAYACRRNGKVQIRTGPDNYCVFFLNGAGCSVHASRPDICRAWPFFRGNMIDAESLSMAKEFCPGIEPAVRHDAFVSAGVRYLETRRLKASDPEREANALIGVLP